MNSAKKHVRQIIRLNDTVYETTFTKKYANRKPYTPKDPRRLTAVIPGLILEVLVRPGDTVRPGQSLLVLEAMKMQNRIVAHDALTLDTIHVTPGDTVTKGQLLAEFR
ncbi:acetyl-CoA carboxylase biotin carboxyl carrier protein subunit [Geothrix sp. PMB-07]|uniref:acetyl-CoA carboxylase biotin carboxyl carrier protein subunit n=1 Tax=Geothrix sp. PMB-07 TaxID=3068640 RepID=UPI002741A843|nr:acetyl-CoA carboxylase biotin carboxyl carrier protein subunit [Geothrix sp. PMB-07]WLT32033.1 acetyl-CoA carboxylase biotin carboxyl carrier protein subunit [Geothrix sp. PMB-07]